MNKRELLKKAQKICKENSDSFRPVSVIVNALALLMYFTSKNNEIALFGLVVLYFSIMIDVFFFLAEKLIRLIIWIIDKRRKKIQEELIRLEKLAEKIREETKELFKEMKKSPQAAPEFRKVVRENQSMFSVHQERIAFLKKKLK